MTSDLGETRRKEQSERDSNADAPVRFDDEDDAWRYARPDPAFPPTIPPPSTAARPSLDDARASLTSIRGRGSVEDATPPARADHHPRTTFEDELSRDILGAERFRAILLATIPTVALFALVVIGGAYPEVLASVLHGRLELAPVGFFLMVVAGFEFYVLAWIKRVLRRGGRPSASRRYAQAFLETSLPTAVILYYAAVDGPVQALLMPTTFVYFLFILLSTLRLDFALCTFTGLVAAGEYAAIALFWGARDTSIAEPALASLAHHLGKAMILLVSGVAAGFVAQRLRRSFTRAIESVGERQRILGVFGQHVSPEVVERLVLGKADVRSELREVCVMFLDIRNFTKFTESTTPGEVVDYLNTVFESTIDAVASRQGIVNKFLGDGFMAIFGAPIEEPDACALAIQAALDIKARIDRLVDEGRIPETRIGVGLHAGKAIVGNIGSPQRKEYTVIGDVVNVASRIEALNKELGTSVLVSDEAFQRSGLAGSIEAVTKDEIAVRGRSQPVRVWQLA